MSTSDVRAALTARLESLRAMAGKLDAHRHAQLPADSEEAAQATQGEEVVDRLDENTRNEIFSIQATLRRIDEGTWGMCTMCGDPIEARRLAILPTATLCVNCAD